MYVCHIKTRELSFVQNLAKEGIFEILATEVVDWKIIIVCIYRSPSSSRESFLELLEETLNNIQIRRRALVLCGDWNINLKCYVHVVLLI
jgi:exonuclease III